MLAFVLMDIPPLQEERKQASFEQLLKVANSEREVMTTIFACCKLILL